MVSPSHPVMSSKTYIYIARDHGEVHVNRTLQQLRRDGLVEMHGGSAILRDRQALAEICEFRGA